jgi:hypothetical protein
VKICAVCGRPFEWRKKWEKVWDEVKYCSDRCRGNRNQRPEKSLNSVITTSKGPTSRLDSSKRQLHHVASLTYASTAIMAGVLSTDRTLSKAAAKELPRRPSREEIDNIFAEPYDWEAEKFSPRDFRRLDESDDRGFYDTPRFVEHIDEAAVQALTKYHDRLLTSYDRPIDILDLCTSWTSHISPSTVKSVPITRFAGLGLNQEELVRNVLLTDRQVQDLNQRYILPYDDNAFDVVLLQLSVDYLVHPVEICREIARILRPNGKLLISFSNRLFLQKAVAVWTGKSDIEHIEIAGKYIHFAGGYREPIQAVHISPRIAGDPIYVVTAIKQ